MSGAEQVIEMTTLFVGLAHFTDLTDELERAISGAKYGDYIMSGTTTLGELPLCHMHYDDYAIHFLTVRLMQSHPFHIYKQGYSDEVDKLRERMKNNETQLLSLVDNLKEFYNLSRLVVAPHKSYVRVLELSKSQAKKAEDCEGLFK